ncbi:MAG: mechanosensitive ion channel [bacterium]
MSFFNELIYSSITFGIALLINFGSLFFYRVFLKKRLNARRNTIVLLILNSIRYLVLLISILIIATICNVDMAALLAGAGFLGLLIGVGMQKMFQDMINGFFIIFENHYVVGEYVMINNITGEVLEIGLRTTKMKTYEGELYLFSNGNIDHVLNYSRFPSLSLVEVHIPYSYNPYYIIEEIKEIVKNYKNNNVLTSIDVLGVQKCYENYYDVRITCYTKSYEHFSVNRQINGYIVSKLKEKNIIIDINKPIEIKTNIF